MHRSAKTELLELFGASTEIIEAIGLAFLRAGWNLKAGEIEGEVARARQPLCDLCADDWAPLEQHLEALGLQYCWAGLTLSVWHSAGAAVSRVVIPRAVARHAGDPERLTELLVMLTTYVDRVLSAITRGYYVMKEQRERQVIRRHERLIATALDAIIEVDEGGIITEFNPAAERMFGYRQADAIGQPAVALIIPERFRAQQQARVSGLATRDAETPGRRFEIIAMRADGSELPVELSMVGAVRLDGRRCFFGWLRDLRAHGQMEESLAMRAHALEQAQFGIVVSDPSTKQIKNVNPAYAALTGYTVEELRGSPGERLIAPGMKEDVELIADTLRQRGHLTYRMRLLRKDGATVPVLAASSAVVTPSGMAVRISTVIDISEQENAERARAAAQRELQRSMARLEILSNASEEFASAPGDVDSLLSLITRRLVASVGEGCTVRMISRDGAWLEPSAHVHHPDPAFADLTRHILGTERQPISEGLAGKVAATGNALLIPVVDADELARRVPPAFRPLLANLGVLSVMVLPMRSRGRTIGVISLARTGGASAYTIDDQRLAQDLSDRAGLAVDNALLVATLEQRVVERTTALEAANRDLESFSYSVSHDLRAPLRAIDGFGLALLEDYQSVLDATAQRYLQQIRTSAQRMATLIDDLLALARVSRAALVIGALDLSALAEGVAAEIRRRDPVRATPVHVAPGLSARADARLMRIVLENLLGNAWKYTSKHPDAQIWVGNEDGAMYVRDTGAGFDTAYAGKLFEPFCRLHGDHEYEGTGIGLAIVARIISHHGGRIWATAEIDKGATFFFTLERDDLAARSS